MNKTEYTYRFLARIIVEAETPIAVGSGDKDIVTDSLVAKDVNGLPYIPGTSIAGVIRHAIGEEKAKAFFGYQETEQSDNGMGSEIIFTDAKMIGKDGIVVDGLQNIDFSTNFYDRFQALPIRQHARINHKGVTENAGKFDEQVVYKGTRFCFEIEMLAKDEGNIDNFYLAINQLYGNTFRIGSGTRSGFGKLKIVSCETATLNLTEPNDLALYMDKDSSLSQTWRGYTKRDKATYENSDYCTYHLTLYPDDFFLFGSGFGDDEADMTPVKEDIIEWDNDDKPLFKTNCILVPATSIKGALAHRTAYYYNQNSHIYADKISNEEAVKHVGKNNEAVKALFGSEGDKPENDETGKISNNKILENQKRGNVIFNDIIEDNEECKDKILNHVAIDRFTGGAMDGALFTEKTTYGKGQSFSTDIVIDNKSAGNSPIDQEIVEAFESALTDMVTGMLPLGGGVNRGNGTFSGEITKNGKPFPKQEEKK